MPHVVGGALVHHQKSEQGREKEKESIENVAFVAIR